MTSTIICLDILDDLGYIMISRNQATQHMGLNMLFNLIIVTLAFAAPFLFVLMCAASLED